MLYLFYFLLFLFNGHKFLTSSETVSRAAKSGEEIILCRKCGADVADSYYLISQSSPGAKNTEKQNLFGKQNVTVQMLVNPFGITFEVVTAEKAKCDNIGPRQGADSWFPGYTWRICACPHCGQHLGWTFEKLSSTGADDNNIDIQIQSFYGLILSNILGENFTDSLIMMPNIYKM